LIINDDPGVIMYLGGRLVLGSGNCCPQDFLFFTCFFSGAGVPGSIESLKLSSSYDCGVMASIGLMASLKRGGYAVPGVETKLSARLSAGEFSNLMCVVGSIVNCLELLYLRCNSGLACVCRSPSLAQ
jgi:hypothetical protein